MIGDGTDLPKIGQLVTAQIKEISASEIHLILRDGRTGIVWGWEIDEIPEDIWQALAVGQEVQVLVVGPNDRKGNVVLSIARAVTEADWAFATALFESKQSYESTIAGFNRGGVVVMVGHLRGFVPGSQLSAQRQAMLGDKGQQPERRFQNLVGQSILVKVIKVDRQRKILMLSERAAAKEANRVFINQFLDSIAIGSIVEGTVSRIKEFGAFVDLLGVEGFIHRSEVAYRRIKHPNEILKEGETVKVKIIAADRDSGRIGLSLKALQPDPWADIGQRLEVGQLVQATVRKTHPKHGAFVLLKDDESIEGIVRIPELSDHPISNPREVVVEGQTLTLRVLSLDPETRRLALSLTRVASMP